MLPWGDGKGIRSMLERIKVSPVTSHAACIKILAERRAGELLKAVERAQGKDGKGLRSTLERTEVSPVTSHRWQTIARVPEEKIRWWAGGIAEGTSSHSGTEERW
jgi:hypothetical protein